MVERKDRGESDGMAFESSRALPAKDMSTPQMDQPGMQIDSMPGSEMMSVEKMSINLSDDEADSPRMEPAQNSDDVEPSNKAATFNVDHQNSVKHDEEYADCNLSEVNYRSIASNNRQALP